MTLLLLGLLLAAPAPAQTDRPAASASAEPSRAKANLASLISDADYPADALRAGEQGTVRFLLDVGADGRVVGCTVIQSSNSAALDSTTCRIMAQRARFAPARDSAGKNVPDQVRSAISWRIGQAAAAPPEVQAAFDTYMRCLRPHFAPALIDARVPLAEVAQAAFTACRTQEDAMLGASNAGETERAGLRKALLEIVTEMRGQAAPAPR